MTNNLVQLIYQVFPRRPDILADLLARQRDYEQALWLSEFVSLALGELEKQLAGLASIDPATSGVDPEPKRLRLSRQIATLNEFLAKLERIEAPQDGYCVAELVRAAEQS